MSAMKIAICTTKEEIPTWIPAGLYESAVRYIEEDDAIIVVARRRDGDTQVVPDGRLDAEVIGDLLTWAAG